MRGLTGLIKFHGNGFRSEFELDIVQLTTKGLKKIGVYNSTSGFDWRSDGRSVLLQEDLELQNTTFKVLIALVWLYINISQLIKEINEFN